jgi:hypothetical protein
MWTAVLLLLTGLGAGNLLSGCGDKFVGGARGTRIQLAPSGRQQTILIYNNPSSDVPAALARVSIDPTLLGAGYRPKTVSTAEDFAREISKGGWDLIVLGLADARALTHRVQNQAQILPVALSVTGVELKQTRKQFSVVVTQALRNREEFVRMIYDGLASRSKGKAA